MLQEDEKKGKKLGIDDCIFNIVYDIWALLPAPFLGNSSIFIIWVGLIIFQKTTIRITRIASMTAAPRKKYKKGVCAWDGLFSPSAVEGGGESTAFMESMHISFNHRWHIYYIYILLTATEILIFILAHRVDFISLKSHFWNTPQQKKVVVKPIYLAN